MKYLLLSVVLLSSCSSIKFNKRNLLLGTLAGSVAGAGVGLLAAKNNEGAAAAVGAAAGGLIGALTVTAISKEEQISFDFLKDLKKNTKKNPSTSSYAVTPKNLPKDMQKFLRAPKVHMGTTGWTELDGELHEPHRYFYYEEGGLNAK